MLPPCVRAWWRRSLYQCGGGHIADGRLLDLIRCASTFGMCMMKLDIRQVRAGPPAAHPSFPCSSWCFCTDAFAKLLHKQPGLLAGRSWRACGWRRSQCSEGAATVPPACALACCPPLPSLLRRRARATPRRWTPSPRTWATGRTRSGASRSASTSWSRSCRCVAGGTCGCPSRTFLPLRRHLSSPIALTGKTSLHATTPAKCSHRLSLTLRAALATLLPLRCPQGRRPLLPPDMPMTPEVREVMDTCRVVAQLGPSSLGAYVISMARGASDVLAVELLQREAVFQVRCVLCAAVVVAVHGCRGPTAKGRGRRMNPRFAHLQLRVCGPRWAAAAMSSPVLHALGLPCAARTFGAGGG